MQMLAPSEFKNCCAALYEDKALRFLLGSSLHPGGLRLTRRLAERIGLSSTDTVLDAASGLGESTRFLAREFGCKVVGVDLSRRLARTATSSPSTAEAHFLVGDGELLPIRDEAVTAVISECSICLMPEFRKGLREIFRALEPNGRVGITDITVSGTLPSELEETLLQILCISNKISWSSYSKAIETEGFETVVVTDESQGLLDLLESIKKRLLLAELLTTVGKLSLDNNILSRGKCLTSLARTAVNDGILKYVMVTAQKPNS